MRRTRREESLTGLDANRVLSFLNLPGAVPNSRQQHCRLNYFFFLRGKMFATGTVESLFLLKNKNKNKQQLRRQRGEGSLAVWPARRTRFNVVPSTLGGSLARDSRSLLYYCCCCLPKRGLCLRLQKLLPPRTLSWTARALLKYSTPFPF